MDGALQGWAGWSWSASFAPASHHPFNAHTRHLHGVSRPIEGLSPLDQASIEITCAPQRVVVA
jgi:hypothetical protein